MDCPHPQRIKKLDLLESQGKFCRDYIGVILGIYRGYVLNFLHGTFA